MYSSVGSVCVLFIVLYYLRLHTVMVTWLLTQQVNKQEMKWTEIKWNELLLQFWKNLLLKLTVCDATLHVSDISWKFCFIRIFVLFLSHTEEYFAHIMSEC